MPRHAALAFDDDCTFHKILGRTAHMLMALGRHGAVALYCPAERIHFILFIRAYK